MTPRAVTVASSPLLCDVPAVPAEVRQQAGATLRRARRLTPRVPAWVTDPDAIASILSGLYEIDDDLTGGA